MKIKTAARPFFLLLGDVFVFLFSLWLTLFVRYAQLPSAADFTVHLVPFSFIFAIWLVVYFIYDFYGNQTTILQKKLSNLLLSAHIINSVIALAFFYLIPYFAITPKTTLFIFLIVSFILLEWWRRHIVFFVTRRAEETVIFAAGGAEAEELCQEFASNHLYQIRAIKQNTLSAESFNGKPIVVINTHDSNTASFVDFYHMLFSGVRFVTLDSLYETVFGRVPISSISERWFLEYVSTQSKILYDIGKRLMDITISLVIGILSLPFYPFIILAIKLDDGGDVFIRPWRIGQGNKPVRLYKFRTMTIGDDGGRWGEVENKVTRVGAFLRRTRLDELPQLWNVTRGELSLIGPRPGVCAGPPGNHA